MRSESRLRWRLLGLLAVVLFLAGMVWPAMRGGSNCGGNSAALAACHGYVVIIENWAADHPGQSFDIRRADLQTRLHLGHLPGATWLGSARLLAKLADVKIDLAGEKRTIMVCDRAYSNVPERLFGRSPMAHAVAYSNGEAGLISPEEFAKLDLRDFIDLRTLAAATESEPDRATSGLTSAPAGQ